MGFALLLALTLLAAVAAVALGARLYADERSRAEVALAAATIWLGLIQLPVHTLGWLERLTAPTLAIASLCTSLVVFVAAHAGRRPFEQLHTTWRALSDVATLPFAAIDEAWRARSIAVLALLAAIFVAAWTFVVAWLAPSSSWDGLWYHEAMVGFALQNRGFGWVELPDYMQAVNGYARNSEHYLIWVTIFADRRLVDAVQSVMSPILVLAFFALARRYVQWRMGAMALGVVFFLTPGVVLQLRSTYIDLTAVTAFVVALYWTTKPRMRGRDVWLAGLALGLVGSSKSTGIYFMGLLGAVSSANVVLSMVQRRSGWLLLHGLGATLVLLALAGPTYGRNLERYGNPLWPLRFRIKALKVDWPGPQDVQDQQYPLSQVLDYLYGPPSPGHDYADTRMHGYGHVLPYLGIPLAVLAFLLLVWRCFAGDNRHSRPPTRAGPWHLLALSLVVIVSVVPSPAYWWSRFQLQAIGGVLLLLLWLLDQKWGSPWREGIVGAHVVFSIVVLFWLKPGWDVPLERVVELAAMRPADRAVQGTGFCQLPTITATARERELGPGDVAVFSDHPFPATLWNERMTNRVVFVPFGSRDQYLAQLDALRAEWAVVRNASGESRALRALPPRWEQVGPAGQGFTAFRRFSGPPGTGSAARPVQPTHPPRPALEPTKMPRALPGATFRGLRDGGAAPNLPTPRDAGAPRPLDAGRTLGRMRSAFDAGLPRLAPRDGGRTLRPTKARP
ncbi:MAG: hypothetical protein IT379_01310 [Deltaproteobacteria bacterium]|nr:hypothetical protein [Deltaproteobacteria bacterium]